MKPIIIIGLLSCSALVFSQQATEPVLPGWHYPLADSLLTTYGKMVSYCERGRLIDRSGNPRPMELCILRDGRYKLTVQGTSEYPVTRVEWLDASGRHLYNATRWRGESADDYKTFAPAPLQMSLAGVVMYQFFGSFTPESLRERLATWRPDLERSTPELEVWSLRGGPGPETVWIGRDDGLIHRASDSTSGVRYELDEILVNQPVADELLTYSAPFSAKYLWWVREPRFLFGAGLSVLSFVAGLVFWKVCRSTRGEKPRHNSGPIFGVGTLVVGVVTGVISISPYAGLLKLVIPIPEVASVLLVGLYVVSCLALLWPFCLFMTARLIVDPAGPSRK